MMFVPWQLRTQNPVQSSSTFSVVTDSLSPERFPQSQVMSPNVTQALQHAQQATSSFQHPPQQQSEGSASESVVHMRMQQMLQIAAPAEVLRLLQSQATTVAWHRNLKQELSAWHLV